MMTPEKYVESPHVAYVNFIVAGKNLTKEPDGRPKSFQSFSVKRIANKSVEWQLTLFDPTWTEVENLLVANPKDIVFWYGYEGVGMPHDVNSPKYGGYTVEVHPSFTIDGVILNVTGAAQEVMANFTDTSEPTAPEGVGLRISEIVEDICKQYNWKTTDKSGKSTVEKTKEIKAAGVDFFDTSPKHLRFLKQGLSDLQFIKNVLVNYAVSEKDNISGYITYFQHADGEKIFHFHPPRREDPPLKTLTYMRGYNSEVLDFSVDVNSMLLVSRAGGDTVAIPYIDMTNGDTDTVIEDDSTTGEKTLLTGKGPASERLAYKEIHTFPYITTLPTDNKEIAIAKAKHKYYYAYNAPVTASMSIIGSHDPNIQLDRVVRVVVINNPDGTQQGGAKAAAAGAYHHSSGNYWIAGVEDIIEGGTWITKLTLTREGSMIDGGRALSGRYNTGGPGPTK
jgi:hypothetical protein